MCVVVAMVAEGRGKRRKGHAKDNGSFILQVGPQKTTFLENWRSKLTWVHTGWMWVHTLIQVVKKKKPKIDVVAYPTGRTAEE